MSQQGTDDARPAPDKSSLSLLVDELLLNIIDHVDSKETLCNLAVTCKRFQSLTEPYIWRSLLVLDGTHTQNITTVLDGHDNRIDAIRELSIRYKNEYKEGIENLNYYLGLMSNLRHLTLESPCPNNSEWGADIFFDGWSRIDYPNLFASAVYPREGLMPTFPMLQSINIHAHGPSDRKFVFDTRTAALFLHPTLRNITISCMNIDTDLQSVEEFKENHKSTPLQSLTLIECNVAMDCLFNLLSMPKALKKLSIGERLHTFPDCSPSIDSTKRTSSPLFLSALQLQADSLQSLTHIGGSLAYQTARETDPCGGEKLRSLAQLTHLELGFESHLYYYLLNGGFPPSLKTLKMLDTAISLNAHGDFEPLSRIIFNSTLSLATQHLPALLAPGFTLRMHLSYHSTMHLFALPNRTMRNYIINSMLLKRPSIYKISNALQARDARFCISRETFASGSAYIPPYMYGEDVPIEKGVYDSDDYWRFNGTDFRFMDDVSLRTQLKKEGKVVVCERCTSRGISEIHCRHMGDGSSCDRCKEARLACVWGESAEAPNTEKQNAEEQSTEERSAEVQNSEV